jgi:hypothetical protein
VDQQEIDRVSTAGASKRQFLRLCEANQQVSTQGVLHVTRKERFEQSGTFKDSVPRAFHKKGQSLLGSFVIQTFYRAVQARLGLLRHKSVFLGFTSVATLEPAF